MSYNNFYSRIFRAPSRISGHRAGLTRISAGSPTMLARTARMQISPRTGSNYTSSVPPNAGLSIRLALAAKTTHRMPGIASDPEGNDEDHR